MLKLLFSDILEGVQALQDDLNKAGITDLLPQIQATNILIRLQIFMMEYKDSIKCRSLLRPNGLDAVVWDFTPNVPFSELAPQLKKYGLEMYTHEKVPDTALIFATKKEFHFSIALGCESIHDIAGDGNRSGNIEQIF